MSDEEVGSNMELSAEDAQAIQERVEAGATEAGVEEVSSSSEPQVSESEQKAVEMGWKPKDQFNEDDKSFVGAEEYVRNQSFFDKIDTLQQRMRKQEHESKEQLRAVNAQVKESKRVGYEQALRDLEGKRNEAVELGDTDSFNTIDSEYARVRDDLVNTNREIEQQAAAPAAPTDGEVQFKDRNSSWFNFDNQGNRQMAEQAIVINNHLMESKPYLTEHQRLESVEKEIKSLYTNRFDNPNKAKPAAVAPTSASSGRAVSGNVTYEGLSSDDKRRYKVCKEASEDMGDTFTFEDFVKSAQLN